MQVTNEQYPPTPPLSGLPSPPPSTAADGDDAFLGRTPGAIGSGTAKIGLIDGHQLSLEYLRTAFKSVVPDLSVCPFASVQDFLARPAEDFDLIIYFWHANDASAMGAIRAASAACRASADIPLIVLSDAEETQHPKTVRLILQNGARGFIPTRTMGIHMALAAIRLVGAGGTFAPQELLPSGTSDRAPALPDAARKHRLTARQMAVLSHLHQGKANKIIAHELTMSESTVKVHVRNIMRKVGATNRTQAVYKAQTLWDTAAYASMPEL
jgi:DNA-binding NarL/FixJ family response regulator